MVSWDIYKKVLKPDADDKTVLLLSKIVVVLSALVTMVLAINPPEMLAILIWMGIGVMLSTFAVPLLAGLYWRGATREGALAAMALGLVSSLVFGMLNYVKANVLGIDFGAIPLHFSAYSFIIAILAMVIVSLRNKEDNREGARRDPDRLVHLKSNFFERKWYPAIFCQLERELLL